VRKDDLVRAFVRARTFFRRARQDEHRARRADARFGERAGGGRGEILFVVFRRERQDQCEFGAEGARGARRQQAAAVGGRTDDPQDRLRVGKERPLGGDDLAERGIDLAQQPGERGFDRPRRFALDPDAAMADDADRQHRRGAKVDRGARHSGVPIPKFARVCRTLRSELRNRKDTRKYMILVPL
jgi:hypothetical protein